MNLPQVSFTLSCNRTILVKRGSPVYFPLIRVSPVNSILTVTAKEIIITQINGKDILSFSFDYRSLQLLFDDYVKPSI